jgi:DNA-binding NtrC family response regulator
MLKEKEVEVLLVDDERAILNVTSDLLKVLGYKTSAFLKGGDAVIFYHNNKERIDLIILDVTMKGEISGIETLKNFKSINPEVRVLVFSGLGKEDDEVRRVMEVGCAGFIQKPFTLGELEKSVIRALSS